jgi:hypothetical protein
VGFKCGAGRLRIEAVLGLGAGRREAEARPAGPRRTRAAAGRRAAEAHAAAQLLVAATAHGAALCDELAVRGNDARPAAVLSADAVGDPGVSRGRGAWARRARPPPPCPSLAAGHEQPLPHLPPGGRVSAPAHSASVPTAARRPPIPPRAPAAARWGAAPPAGGVHVRHHQRVAQRVPERKPHRGVLRAHEVKQALGAWAARAGGGGEGGRGRGLGARPPGGAVSPGPCAPARAAHGPIALSRAAWLAGPPLRPTHPPAARPSRSWMPPGGAASPGSGTSPRPPGGGAAARRSAAQRAGSRQQGAEVG